MRTVGGEVMLILDRVEKYRPNSLEEVNGHKDVLDTIGKFVDANVRSVQLPFPNRKTSN